MSTSQEVAGRVLSNCYDLTNVHEIPGPTQAGQSNVGYSMCVKSPLLNGVYSYCLARRLTIYIFVPRRRLHVGREL